jgi:tetratricopeptide (TPR) repeat protein
LASSILWPASLTGQPLFESRRQAADSFIGRLRERIGFVAVEQHLSSPAQHLLAGTIADIDAMLDEARHEFDHDPLRALALTELAVERSAIIPVDDTTRARVQGRAWKEHGNALFMTGRLADASAAAARAATIFSNYPALAGERTAAMLLMALVANALGNSNHALSLLDECAVAFEAQGERFKRLTSLEIRAITLFDLGQFGNALQTLQAARLQADALRLEAEIARVEHNIARCLIKMDRLEEAQAIIERAEMRFASLGMDTEVLRSHWCKAELMKKKGNSREALIELERLKPEFKRRGMSRNYHQVEQDIAELRGAA